MSEVQKDPEDISAGIGQKKKCKVLIKFSCNLRSKSARSTLTSPGSIRVNSTVHDVDESSLLSSSKALMISLMGLKYGH